MPTFIVIPVLLIAGFIIGMLVNYLADVLPANRRLTAPVCLGCLSHRQWVPFLTFRPCETCGRKVGLRAIITSILFMALTVYFYFFPSQRLGFWPMILLLAYFGVVLINDLEYRVVLFQVSIAGLALGTVYGYFLHGLLPTLLGGLAAFVVMYILYLGGGWFTRYLGKKRGQEVDEIALGFGDVYIGSVIGLLLGWPAVAAGLMIGIIAGGLVSGLYMLGMMIMRRYQPLSALPYTPFLILGAIVLLFLRG